MATSQGETTASTTTSPLTGRNVVSQSIRRSTTASAATVPPTTSRMIGPFSRMPAPIASQNTAGAAQPALATRSRASHRWISAACASTMVASSIESVRACRASTVSTVVHARMTAATVPTQGPNNRRPIHAVASTVMIAPSSDGSRYAQIAPVSPARETLRDCSQ